MDQNKKEARDISSAIFLIFIGVVFLLNTTGIVGWGIWLYMFRFWPIFLILAGLRLIFNKSIATEIILIILSVILFAFVGIFSYISETSKPLQFVPNRINDYILENHDRFFIGREPNMNEDETISLDEYLDVEKRTLDINIGASEFLLNDNPELEDYLLLNSRYTENFVEPSLKSELTEEKVLAINFETISPRRITDWNNTRTEFNFTLGKTELKTDINIILGAGKGEVDLKSLTVENITAKIGAGELIFTLDEKAIPSSLNIEVGAGSMVLNIPESIGYKLSYDLGIGEISENGNEIATFSNNDGGYESENYNNSELKIEIVAKVGVGSLEINNI